MNDHRDAKVKVTVRFFNIEERVIHTTDKTEIEIDTAVSMYIGIRLYSAKNGNETTEKKRNK